MSQTAKKIERVIPISEERHKLLCAEVYSSTTLPTAQPEVLELLKVFDWQEPSTAEAAIERPKRFEQLDIFYTSFSEYMLVRKQTL